MSSQSSAPPQVYEPIEVARKELEKYLLAWESKRNYHQENLRLLIDEHDSLGNGYSLELSKYTPSNKMTTCMDNQVSLQPSHMSLRNRNRNVSLFSEVASRKPTEISYIDYKAQFYAELRAWHDAMYARLLVGHTIHHIGNNPNPRDKLTAAMVKDARNLGLPPAQLPACPKFDDMERVFDTEIFYAEEPNIVAGITEMEPEHRKMTEDAIETLRAQLSFFPPFIKGLKYGDGIPSQRGTSSEDALLPVCARKLVI